MDDLIESLTKLIEISNRARGYTSNASDFYHLQKRLNNIYSHVVIDDDWSQIINFQALSQELLVAFKNTEVENFVIYYEEDFNEDLAIVNELVGTVADQLVGMTLTRTEILSLIARIRKANNNYNRAEGSRWQVTKKVDMFIEDFNNGVLDLNEVISCAQNMVARDSVLKKEKLQESILAVEVQLILKS